MVSVLTPKHTPDPGFELKFHESCGHITWHRRQQLLADFGDYQAPSHIPHGLPLCPTCYLAKRYPDPNKARLVGSLVRERIIAIGFERSHNPSLKEHHFKWHTRDELWVLQLAPSDLKKHLRQLATTLDCPASLIDVEVVPPLPGNLSAILDPLPPDWAMVSCHPDGTLKDLAPAEEMNVTPIGTIAWPPDLNNLPSVESAGLASGVPRLLCLPSVADLLDQGFSCEKLLVLMVQAADMGVALITADGKFDGRGVLPLLRQTTRAQGGSAIAPQKSAKPKGGRPASARSKSPEILVLAAQGLSANKIADRLKISARSVGRILKVREMADIPQPMPPGT
ncbi:MAG: helix-turn-helix domain-containing protein [Syntrophobacteraceae bacterium]|nr:helix-turn-helix domain-containing protein [Syntrophobacteraceae bacterium]